MPPGAPPRSLPFLGLLILASGLWTLSCGEQVLCTADIKPALIVQVRAATTGEPAGNGATVTVIDGVFSTELEPVSALEFAGPPERTGTYVVRVSKPGYVPVELADVVVGRDECHVVPVTLQADLVPDAVPACVSDLIVQILNQPPYGAVVTRAVHGGRLVYYVPQPCCDFPNPLYDSSCRVICHPDGGIGGTGDGLCPDYYDERWDVQVIWEDPRQ